MRPMQQAEPAAPRGVPSDEAQRDTPRVISWKLLAVLVVIVGVVAYFPATFGDFIYDDRPLILNNPYVHSFAWWKRWVTHDFWDVSEEIKRFGQRMIYWRPFITASYAVDWKLGGGDTPMFHLTNLVWQGAGSLLAFLALRRWIGALLPAFFAALLFAVHPTKAESVAWIAGRTDVFCLVAVLLAGEGMARRLRGQKGGLALEIFGTILAYATKEQAIVLPAFAAVEAWVALGRPAIDLEALKKMVRAAAPQIALAAVYLVIRTKFLPVTKATVRGFLFREYLEQIAETLGHYFELLVYPHDLSVQQALVESHDGRLVITPRYVVLGLVMLVALVTLAVSMRKKAPPVTVGIALFFVTVLPTSNVVPMRMMTMVSERFLYMPSIGIALAVGWGLHLLDGRVRAQKLAFGAAAVAIVALFAIAFGRSADYADQRRFWAREIATHPDSLEAWRFVIGNASDDRHYVEALRATIRGQTLAASSYGHTGSEAEFILQGADILSFLVPDLDAKDLRAIDRFYSELLDPSPGAAQLDVPPVHVDVQRRAGAVQSRLQALRPQILISRAVIASRIGDDAAALALAEQARNECPRCTHQVAVIAIVKARAGDYAGAQKVLDELAAMTGEASVKEQREIVIKAQVLAKQAEDAPEGPIKLNLRARELSQLDAWGRGYEVLRPYKEQIKKAPGFALGFAELAYRAGDEATAREVLQANVPAEKIEPTIKEWRRKMGWV